MSDAAETESWLPEPDAESAPFFDGAQEGKLRLQACTQCDAWTFPVKTRCQQCGSAELEWRDACGEGVVYSHARLRRPYHPRHRDRLPLVLAWVDIPEGVRLMTNIVDADPEAIKVGMAVKVQFETFPDGGVIPVFAPA